MASHYLFKYYWGVMLPKICFALGVPQIHHKKVCPMLHKMFKEYLCLKTISDLNDHEMLTFLSIILMILAREFGVLLPFMNESDDIQEMSMRDWLALQRIIDK